MTIRDLLELMIVGVARTVSSWQSVVVVKELFSVLKERV